MRFRLFSTFIIGLTLLAAVALLAHRPPALTRERLPHESMARLVERPLAAVKARGLAGGDAEFERLVASETAGGASKARIADLYMSYGVQLHMLWMDSHDPALLQASWDRIHASVPRYRAAFGSVHPEVALALNTFADIDELMRDGLRPEGEAALREALAIRRATLGNGNIETLDTDERIARIDRVRKRQRARREANSARAASASPMS